MCSHAQHLFSWTEIWSYKPVCSLCQAKNLLKICARSYIPSQLKGFAESLMWSFCETELVSPQHFRTNNPSCPLYQFRKLRLLSCLWYMTQVLLLLHMICLSTSQRTLHLYIVLIRNDEKIEMRSTKFLSLSLQDMCGIFFYKPNSLSPNCCMGNIQDPLVSQSLMDELKHPIIGKQHNFLINLIYDCFIQ